MQTRRLSDRLWFIVIVSSFCLCFALGLSFGGAPGGKPEKPARLDVPTEITCTISGDQLTVMWKAVERATSYRVMLEAGADDEAMEPVTAPPYVQAVSDLTDGPLDKITVKVKAMSNPKGGKGASPNSPAMPCQAAPTPAQLPTKP